MKILLIKKTFVLSDGLEGMFYITLKLTFYGKSKVQWVASRRIGREINFKSIMALKYRTLLRLPFRVRRQSAKLKIASKSSMSFSL